MEAQVDCGAKIVFVSDSDLPNEELEKIKDFTVKIIAKHHGEYDFGSYKIGFEYCLNSGILDDFDELIFANDSCYAPLAPFEKMFETMDKKDVDFWGITANKTKSTNFILHIQSFFLAFRKSVFNSDYFKNMVHSFFKLSSKEDIIFEYECGVTKKLEDFGFKWEVYCPLSLSHSDAYIYDYKKHQIKDLFGIEGYDSINIVFAIHPSAHMKKDIRSSYEQSLIRFISNQI